FWQGAADGTLIGVHFVAWRTNAPTDPLTTEPDEPCAYVAADGWEDTYCSDQRPYVCEWY
ncbi:MAG TPA: hypothetical protein VM686_33290, partial [Polyangiaceae bacterium]|nr:hypothetical protein [Polyangiaceae bacterium]